MRIIREPKLLYAGQVSSSAGWHFPGHKHDDLHEILYIREGSGYFTIGDRTYAVRKGDIVVYNRGVLHEERSLPDFPFGTYCCGFSNIEIEGLPLDRILPDDASPVINGGKYATEMEALMSVLFEESSMEEEGYQTICRGLLVSILTLIQRIAENGRLQEERAGDALALSIKEYLDRNFANSISLQMIAEHFHVDRYYLSHVFKKQYNDSPINYLINRRMGEAKRLLASTEMKVWEIAKLVGYENANYFSMLFAKFMGETPSYFKRNHRKNLHYPQRPD
ncbi:helix-turn-helix transcriptional regulator [Paenibacillus sp. HN-1]|uniref:helix-turn-helix domain-containing protein n=1 Tax=Paenibacillus TaxID=44249 RepID=UPI001CA91972|nr:MULTISPECIES: AraC family transcriptional regulator [Paenibacillus]MBY9079145.1 helix-turn-helix transcriptional regulator [Paenibacillus sp. CGMCC 1.18879]MBY9086923.1 helix-turn-helix transcriptional regulator [Paenibacillus sinensis]